MKGGGEMETPNKITVEEWQRQKQDYLAEQAYKDATSGEWKHSCGAPLMALNTRVSEHDQRFSGQCSGYGETVKVEVPYCPTCEPYPAEGGCIHVCL